MSFKSQIEFCLHDQKYFADLSGDFNLVHLDSKYARRSLWGEIAVHGIHQLLCALENYLSKIKSPIALSNLNVEFVKPLGLDAPVDVLLEENNQSIELKLVSKDSIVYTSVRFDFQLEKNRMDYNIKQVSFEKSSPTKLKINDINQNEYFVELLLNRTLLKKNFPYLNNFLPIKQIAIILATTRIVGMKCPGENSIFSELNLSFRDDEGYKSNKIFYKVKKAHKVFKMVNIGLSGEGFDGMMKTFIRPEAQQQETVENLTQYVTSEQFKGERALVIGGSRGIGEVASKLLSLGGAEVTLTYNKGEKEAQKIVEDLKMFGCTVKYMQHNVLDKAIEIEGEYSHLYYFASPFIFCGEKDRFSTQIFENFSNYYISAFLKTVQSLLPGGLKNVFYPSSTAIDELINGMWEYSAAKTAGEHVCELLEKRYPELTVFKPRFPRTTTDQTVSLMPVKSESPEVILEKLLKDFHKAVSN